MKTLVVILSFGLLLFMTLCCSSTSLTEPTLSSSYPPLKSTDTSEISILETQVSSLNLTLTSISLLPEVVSVTPESPIIETPESSSTVTKTTISSTPKASDVPPETPIIESTPEDRIVDLFDILNRNILDVEKILGQPTEKFSLDPDIYIPEGGYHRTYVYKGFTIYVDYDKNFVAKYFQIVEGLREYKYSFDDWWLLTDRLNLYLRENPEKSNNALVWRNEYGFFIRIFRDSDVWSIQVWVNPE